jgi:hypothetical protein
VHPRGYCLIAVTGLKEKDVQINSEYLSKVLARLTSDIYTTYESVSKEWGNICGLNCRNARIGGETQCITRHHHLAALEEKQSILQQRKGMSAYEYK